MSPKPPPSPPSPRSRIHASTVAVAVAVALAVARSSGRARVEIAALAAVFAMLAGMAGTTPALAAGDVCDGQGNATIRLEDPPPAVGTRLRIRVEGRPLRRFAVLADVGPGPTTRPNIGTFCLDLGPELAILADGIRGDSPRLGSDGSFDFSRHIPSRPSLAGRKFYVQVVIDDRKAPNGYSISNVIEVDVLPSIVEKFTSTARRDAAVTNAIWNGNGEVVGTVSSIPRIINYQPMESGFNLSHPLVGTNDPLTVGCRFQMKFEPQFVGFGIGESIVGMDWAPKSGLVFQSTYADVSIKLGHFDDSLSPSLRSTFDENYPPNEPPSPMYQGDYVMPNASGRGWFPWPTFVTDFDYDATRSLVFEFDMPAGGTTFQLFRNFSNSPTPAYRRFGDGGSAEASNPTENTVYWTRFLVLQDRSYAQSIWIDTGDDSPDWLEPEIRVADLPDGTGVRPFYEGGEDADRDGVPETTTGFRELIDDIDGSRGIRFRLVLEGDPPTGAVPTVSRIAIPWTPGS